MNLIAENVVAGYGDGPDVVHSASVSAESGKVTTLLGPNGCGKSTLLKSMSRVLMPRSGSVRVGEQSIHELGARQSARLVGLLPQQPLVPEGITVAELVARGRHPYRGFFGGLTSADRKAVSAALTATDTESLATKLVTDLSGGQRQRVWFALVLAQDTPVILLDEPTTYLDPAHAIEVLELARKQARSGKTILMVLHDLMLAGMYSDTLVLMKKGTVISTGPSEEVLTEENLAAVYGLRAEVWPNPHGSGPVIVPQGVVGQSER